MTYEFDAIVIGTGQAGPSLAGRLDSEGLKTAVIERKKVGGTCVNYGCIPTKALVASARAVHMARRGEEFGFTLESDPQIDIARVKARMEEISGKSNQGVTGWIESMKNVTLVRGHARFENSTTVVVGEDRYTAPRIFINVGGRSRVPNLSGLGEVDFMTSSGILELDEVPEHLIVVGGSYIGLEFAQIYRRFGSRVTVIEMGPRLIGREDEDVSGEVARILEKEGIELHLRAECLAVRPSENGGVEAEVGCDVGPGTIKGSHLLVATGRVPNTDDLGVDRAGIELDERGFIKVDDHLRTNVDGVWALGDCNGRGAFTHTAYNDFEIVAANLFDSDPRKVSDRIVCYGLFIDPPLGRVGMTEAQAREYATRTGHPVLVGKREMRRVGRAKERSETDGFMKFLVDGETEKLLGAVILGVGGDEIIHSIIDVMYSGAPYTTISRAVHVHPTVAELVPTTLQELRPLEP